MTERLTEDYYDDMQKITRHSVKSDNIDLNTGGDDFQDIIDKLAEYETAEEEGRLYILPHGVNVGDCVHAICRFMRDKASTIGINRIMCSEIPMIGRIVSPSHEEIKKVLEKMPKSDSNSESQQLEIKVCRYEKEKT